MTSQQVKQVRKALGLTQQEFAAKLGVSFAAVNRWEKGHNEPQPDRVARIQELLGEIESKRSASGELMAKETPPQRIDFQGSPEAVKLVVDAYRLRNGHLFNKAYGLELSRIVPLPHQRIAVYEYLLARSPLRFLLADDAGAGKTVMTGLYILEMLNRGRIKRILICCPAGLVFNWQREMLLYFELNFSILGSKDFQDSDPVSELEPPLFIMSVDTAATEQMSERLLSADFDLVVFDEAHKLSWGDANRAESKTLRYRLAEGLSRRVPNLLLLTATPHMGKEFPYYALWRLLDPDVFSTVESIRSLPAERRDRYFLRRLKEEMIGYDGKPIYKPRLAQTVPVALTPEEQLLYSEAVTYLQWSYANNLTLNRNAAAMVVAVLQRRLASSTYALLESMNRLRQKRADQRTRQPQTSGRELDRLVVELDGMTADDSDATEDRTERIESLEDNILALLRPNTTAQIEQELVLIERVLAQGMRVKQDAKFARLRELLESPEYHNERVLVFTEHRDTLVYLQSQLHALGYVDRVAAIHGGMDAEERERQRAFFMPKELRLQYLRPEDLARLSLPSGSANVMVATDAAGEGINLQFAWIMVNYDLPWNPARLEQRMGRLHRFGQRHPEVRIFNLVANETREGKVLETILAKLEEARRALSTDKVFDVIGQQLPETSIRDLLLDALVRQEDSGWEKKLEARLSTDRLRDTVEKMRLQASRYGDVGRRIGQLQTEIQLESFTHLLPAYVQNFVEKCAEPLGFALKGSLSEAAAFTLDRRKASWIREVLPHLPDGLPEYLSVRRESLSADLAGQRVHFIRPGDPLFEGLCDEILRRFRADALRAALFRDPTSSNAYAVAFYVFQIGSLPGASAAAQELNSCRSVMDRGLIGIRWDVEGTFAVCATNHLLALDPGSVADLWRVGALLRNPEERVREADQYVRATIESERLRDERSALRAEACARSDELKRSFDLRAADLAQRRGELARKARGGDAESVKRIAEVKQEQALIEEQRDRAIESEEKRPDSVGILSIERVAVGIVIPDDSVEARESYDRNIEEVAMRIARNFEVDRFGARVIDVSAPHLARGYDLESHRPGGETVAIEVKGRSERGPIHLTENEWPTAINVRDRYWLYVVVDCATNPRLYRVQDPAYKLAVKSRQSFTVSFGDILREAEQDG